MAVEELEFGKTCIDEMLKALRRGASIGLIVEVTRQEATGRYIYQISAERYLRSIQVLLSFERDGERIFPPEVFQGEKIRFLSLVESLDYEAERLCLVERGNQWFFKNTFGEPKVQDC